jgi:hypothetical protein
MRPPAGGRQYTYWYPPTHPFQTTLQPSLSALPPTHPSLKDFVFINPLVLPPTHPPTRMAPPATATSSPRAAHCGANNPRTAQRTARTGNQPTAHRTERSALHRNQTAYSALHRNQPAASAAQRSATQRNDRAAHCITNNLRTAQRNARTGNQPAAHRPPRTARTSQHCARASEYFALVSFGSWEKL